MHALLTSELLSIWERGFTLTRAQQALLLLTLACPETPPEALAHLSIGQRDGRLLTLREWAFGQQLAAVAVCPQCGEHLELTFASSDIRVKAEEKRLDIYAFDNEEYQVRFRLPNSLDLMAVAASQNVRVARAGLFRRCLLSLQHHGQEQSPDRLPPEVCNAIAGQMVEADPQAEVKLSLSCLACNHIWEAAFDIVAFFWSEINAWAYRILQDVHTLAAAYGWSEADILDLNPRRRQYYLEMAGIGT
jgi:hypothetical protein